MCTLFLRDYMTSPIDDTAAAVLEGMTIPGSNRGEWRAAVKLPAKPTSGGNFSVCYRVEHVGTGQSAFMKATDVGLMTRQDTQNDPLRRLMMAAAQFNFERSILELCAGNNLDRIVSALDHGQIEVEFKGARELVFYLVFEEAAGDVRADEFEMHRKSPSWIFRAMHNLSVAVQQLHSQEVAHNDIKPSNLLVFDAELQKLADFGRATATGLDSPLDGALGIGDLGYLAPEMMGYRRIPLMSGNKVAFEERAMSDIYLLGSMAFFFITGSALTPVFQRYLSPLHRHNAWTGTFAEVLPFLYDAHANAMTHIDQALQTDWSEADRRHVQRLGSMARELTQPDPAQRGDPTAGVRGARRENLQRYVSQLDRWAKEAQIN